MRFSQCSYLVFACALLLAGFAASGQGNKAAKPVPPITVGAKGELTYGSDDKGNRIPDFSYCGYKAGDEAIPFVAVKATVPYLKGDATLRIQSAIDYVASLPIGKDGFRGAVLLEKGDYEVTGSLKIKSSGIVLRGSGMGNNGTTITGSGFSRQTLVSVAGKNDKKTEAAIKVSDAYVPVNALKFRVSSADNFKEGDMITIRRSSTKEWIQFLGTDQFGGGETTLGWKPGQRDIFWDRRIVAVNGNEISIDAPLTTALDTAFGGGTIANYSWNGRINNVGIENLNLVSRYDETNLKDEDHRWMAIVFENVSDAWVRQVAFRHFAGSAVNVLETAKRITVEDCLSEKPISEIGGERRNTFLTTGQQTLFQRLYAENGYHDFAVGYTAPGPNAFVQCESHLPYSFSGAIDSWASGVLFDIVNVDGNALSYANRGQDGQGAGWSAANSVFWQCSASRIENFAPPGAQNWAFGSWAQFSGSGYWDMSNEQIKPRSLYYAQLQARLGDKALSRAIVLPVETEASSSPKVEVALALTKLAEKPAAMLSDFIRNASKRQPISLDASGAKTIDQIGLNKVALPAKSPAMKIQNGWLVRWNEIITGKRQEVPWWNGSSRPYALANSKPHITRYVPGRTGLGLTDDLNELTDWMKLNDVEAIDHNYGLWYERRRDDHERIRRMDGDVWPPFYELPFARSGQGTAWDGLSKYDLTKYNKFYWSRLKEFADLADEKGLLLIHQNYFQHNIIEAGAHYADFPWRTANNINNTGFPEPVPYAGDKRIFMGEQFYDIANPVRRAIHRAFIRKCLDNFADNTSVIQSIGAEFTGPLHFVQFWLDVIQEWQKEKGKNALVALSTTKDVQDAILADPRRASVVDIIDIRYWHYQANGTAYEPLGGQNLAPRQHARLLMPKKTSFEQVYRAVKEYKDKYPAKAVIYSGDSFDQFGMASFLAGGSMAQIAAMPRQLMADAAKRAPVLAKSGLTVLADNANGTVIYTDSPEPVPVDFTGATGKFSAAWVDAKTGEIISQEKNIGGSAIIKFNRPKEGALLLWVTKSL